MVSFSPLLLLLVAVASAAPIISGLITADTLISDINNIDIGVNSLTAHLKAYTGGTLSATPILGDIAVIHLANRKGYADANLAPSFGSADSARIIKFTAATVAVDIPASVEVLKSKKAYFEAAGMTPLVESSLMLLKNDHDTFSAALVAKSSEDSRAAAHISVQAIDDALQSGIDYFAS